MSATSAPFGLRPVYHPTGLVRAKKYTIASAYGTAIYKNQPVILNTNGTITAGTAAADLVGVFAGCEYTDSTGKRNVSPNWIASTTATDIVAWVYDDPDIIFEIQADGSVAQNAIGDAGDLTNASSGSTTTGLSACTFGASTLSGPGASAQLRIVGFGQQVDNAPGDAYTIVQVTINEHSYAAAKNAL